MPNRLLVVYRGTIRVPLIAGFLAVALGASACSSTPVLDPWPSSAADGLITEISSPDDPFPVSWTVAIGTDGTAVVYFLLPPNDIEALNFQTTGIAFVHRDGTYELIVDPHDERFSNEWPTDCRISDSTVAWSSKVIPNDEENSGPSEYVLHFWDRESKQMSVGVSVVTDGELAGEPFSWNSQLFVLLGEVAYWIEHASTTSTQKVILAATGDGHAWKALDSDHSWFRLGHDPCASMSDRPRLWAITADYEGESANYVSWQIDASDPIDLRLIEGSEIPLDPWKEGFHVTYSHRCGDDLLVLARNSELADSNGWDPFAIVTTEDPLRVDYLNMHGTLRSLYGSALTPNWVALSGSPLSWGQRSIIHRPSGTSAEVPSGPFCPFIEIQGDYVWWQVLREEYSSNQELAFLDPEQGPLAVKCDTYIGVLTPPTD